MTYPSAAELQENIDILVVLKESMEADNVFVMNGSVNGNFHGHLEMEEMQMGKLFWNLTISFKIACEIVSEMLLGGSKDYLHWYSSK